MDTYLFIDGENLLYKVKDALREIGTPKHKIDLNNLDLSSLIAEVLVGYTIAKKTFYAAKLKMFKETKEKSRILIHKQRVLKQNLERQGFEFLIAGNVRPQAVSTDGKTTYVFKEKGVDVKIAVDLVSLCCDKKIDTAILCSSDSDLQPAITEIKRRGVKVVYLGFEISPNKGLTFTCDKTILFRNSEILKHCPPKH
ncbi:MAG: hypothetical protein UV55_C0030G0005 [Candidatus Gottesmanbacteria bacterium GW2011_GWC1_43_10]|nr:MAG: hypothetical protein UV04_C0023G0010 [Candidatus Gottesmanbacteria bacterium GW2011_GWA2_42_16]KKS52177.1 MAG: hypothetical protein UV17_C0050G0003 [Candidatus Gottesmanbacteria bacterium GW2011_GWA1_42_26]KKS80785.1 MAG: hypothetical protein UV55_C0030G0005 [Candidatus Gottesmanbacteria bacterium GW2011_GWC1_43_10]OGG07596.1 MAG: hypothetical protein A2699_02050 [Candidatus Gottesmanbacteria bacterium RIFCSPHIGHO2_01_FULL_43_15]OGG28031.1 MAG: hypothetical protein A3A59_06330 [Candidat